MLGLYLEMCARKSLNGSVIADFRRTSNEILLLLCARNCMLIVHKLYVNQSFRNVSIECETPGNVSIYQYPCDVFLRPVSKVVARVLDRVVVSS